MTKQVLLPEIARHILRFLDSAELLRLAPVSRSIMATVCSILKARMLGLLHAPKKKAVYFESSSPASPSIQLSHRLLFQGFVERSDATELADSSCSEHPSCMTASFCFCDEDATTAHPSSQSMSFAMDPHQSFETLLLSVRLQPVENGERDVRQEIEVAEGLERIWRSWFELPKPVDLETEDASSAECAKADAEDEEHSRGRKIERTLNGAATPGLSHRTVSIDKTIAKATVLLHPFSNVASKSAASISRERRHPTHETIHGAAKQCTLAWRSLELNVARVVIEHERAEKRKASQIVIYWSGGSTPA